MARYKFQNKRGLRMGQAIQGNLHYPLENYSSDIYPFDSVSHQSQLAPQSHLTTPNYVPLTSSNLRESYLGEKGKAKDRYCCGCFRTRRGCCAFFIVFSIVLGITFGLLLFFLYPRIPQITVSDPFLTPNTQPFALSTANAAASIDINFSLNIAVASQNYISFDVKYLLLIRFI